MTNPRLVTAADVRDAQRAIADRVRRTPMMRSAHLSERFGVEMHFKLELFQKTGSFKVRGALNRMLKLSDEERHRGVVTVSAGNHAQAVAWAAREVGTKATVVMYARAVRSKVEATKGYGGDVIQSDRDLLEVAAELQKERGLVMVHPFDDPAVIAGAGTVGDEIMDDVPETDVILVGVGGGGIVSGVAVAAKARRAGVRIVGVEPEGAAAMRLSLDRGSPQKLDKVDTIADGLAAPFAGELTYPVVRDIADGVVLVTDDEIAAAMSLILMRCKLLAEPAGAAATAALLAGKVPQAAGKRVVAILSGGNVDLDRLKSLL
jgi:threonine ammonia-lyase medium form